MRRRRRTARGRLLSRPKNTNLTVVCFLATMLLAVTVFPLWIHPSIKLMEEMSKSDSWRIHPLIPLYATTTGSSSSSLSESGCPMVPSFLQHTLPKQQQQKHNAGACAGFRGILHIRSGDQGAAGGTLFFQYVINQLLYAEQHLLLPWIHLDNVSRHIYDDEVHGGGGDGGTTHLLPMRLGATVGWTSLKNVTTTTTNSTRHPQQDDYYYYPSSPSYYSTVSLSSSNVHTNYTTVPGGNGVWECYFQPVSAFSIHDASCMRLPLVQLSYAHLTPGIQFHAPWSVRSWPYHFLPESLAPLHAGTKHNNNNKSSSSSSSLHDWYGPMRRRAHRVVQKYYRPQPWLRAKIDEALLPASSTQQQCLAMHIRHSDKGGLARRRLAVSEFLPYLQAYLNVTTTTMNLLHHHHHGTHRRGSNMTTTKQQQQQPTVYLATDSTRVVTELRQSLLLPSPFSLVLQPHALRSSGRHAVFAGSSDYHGHHQHHRTNTEALVDIWCMSKCQFLLHGFSAMSEAAIYLNIDLHERSVDLEDPQHDSVPVFENKVREYYTKQRAGEQTLR